MFIAAIGEYHRYTQNESVLGILFGTVAGGILGGLSVVVCAICVWGLRAESASTVAFGQATSLVMALTIFIIPMSALYNQVLLAPAILALLWSESAGATILPAIRLARVAGAILLAWPWIATLGLSLAYFWLTPALRQKLWPMPFYSSFMVPVFIFGLALLNTWTSQPGLLRDGAPAE
jgi:hypothetical protein